jgi:hypothetical protein
VAEITEFGASNLPAVTSIDRKSNILEMKLHYKICAIYYKKVLKSKLNYCSVPLQRLL